MAPKVQKPPRLLRRISCTSRQRLKPLRRRLRHPPKAPSPQRRPEEGVEIHTPKTTLLPKITVFGTGGTIAGFGTSAERTIGYRSGVLSVQGLISEVPELGRVARLRSQQMINVGSPDIMAEDLIRLAQAVERELEGDADGVVVTHGTDTMEETAFFLDLTIKSEKPVVLVGAMRPATAHSADGPMNLLCAVKLAAHGGSRGRGVMVVMNDRICAARYVTKTNANTLDSFRAEEQGYLGVFVDTRPVFYYPPCRPFGQQHFDVACRDPRDGLPQVDILYGHVDMNPALLAVAAETSRGVVLAAMGGGSWGTRAGHQVAELVRTRDYPVVVSRRMASGFVSGSCNHGLGDCCIGGGLLDANRCRIQLQLALAAGLDRWAIKDVFEGSRGVGGGVDGNQRNDKDRFDTRDVEMSQRPDGDMVKGPGW
ncbi:hypothetical protein HIM_02412 [Hirsutella minnesotensis 3608]|nr:hypothetical protein HIM_02412 [Hirsutella minnesotensis 3608]